MSTRLAIGLGITLVLGACVPFFDATPSGSLADTSTPDVGGDTATDTSTDADADSGPDTGNLNACGGELDLRLSGVLVQPSDRCGGCDDGSVVCNGPNSVRCVGASEPNQCGECFDLGGAVAQSCGPCGEGVLQCGDNGALICVGDAPLNACGGCGSLDGEPGTPCFVSEDDGAGTWVCEAGGVLCLSGELNACGGDLVPLLFNGDEAELEQPCDAECGDGRLTCGDNPNELICTTEADARANSCGGCNPLPGELGDDCGRCGTWACNGEDDMTCVDEAPNSCGGCIPLTVERGEFCPDGTRAFCVGDVTNCGAGNGCGGETPLDEVPGSSCGACGVWQCDGTEQVECGGRDENECGGCLPLPGFGRSCGTCGSGELVCQGSNALQCEGDAADATNACGGCTTLAGIPGEDCGDCGGHLVCSTSGTDLVCSISENACGGCEPFDVTIGDDCESDCGAGLWACSRGAPICTALDEELNACGTCGPLPLLYGQPCGCGGVFNCDPEGLFCDQIACGGLEQCDPTDSGACGATRCQHGYCQPTAASSVELITDVERPNGDEFGFSITSNSDWLAIGAPGTDSERGRVYLFEDVRGVWNYRQYIEREDTAPFDRFGHSVAINDENILIVGSPGADDHGANAGTVEVYEYLVSLDGVSSWVPTTDPLGNNAAGQAMGTALAWVDDDTFLVGAPYRELTGGLTGAVAEFSQEGDRWFVVNTMDATQLGDGVFGQQFGFSIAAHPGGALIGAPESDYGETTDAGAVLVARRTATTGVWLRPTTRTAPTPESTAYFGYRVATSDDLEAISAPFEDGDTVNEGGVYAYVAGDDGTSVTRIVTADLGPEDAFGEVGLDVEGDLIAVGSEWHDFDAADAGALWLFEATDSAPIELVRKIVHPFASGADRGGYVDLRFDSLLYGAVGNQVTSGGGAAWSFYSF